MIYNPRDKNELEAFFAESDRLVLLRNILIELRGLKPTRSLLQNNAMWLYLTNIAIELNKSQTFEYRGLSGKMMELPFNKNILHYITWIPAQKYLFKTDSTRLLETNQLNIIIESIDKFLGQNFNIYVDFPHDSFKNIEEEKNVL